LTAEPKSIALRATETDALARELRGWPCFPIEDLDGRLLEDVASRRSCLPSRMVDALVGFTERPGPAAGLLIQGLPIDEALPETPLDGRPSPSKDSRVSESVLVLAASVLGSLIGYRQEKEGLLIHDVCPQPGREDRQENSGSQYFDVHTENAFHPLRPDHVLLLCLRDDVSRTARTMVGSAAMALPLLPARDIEVLRQPLFRHRMPTSFVTGGEAAYSSLQPVLTGPEDDQRMCVDAFNTVAANDDAGGALDHLVGALKSVLVGPVLAPGDLLVVDNRRAVHARTGFEPRYDGSDRWLQRAFALCDLARTDGARIGDSHVCELPTGVNAS
jgi:L-asparagine oxygenase